MKSNGFTILLLVWKVIITYKLAELDILSVGPCFVDYIPQIFLFKLSLPLIILNFFLSAQGCIIH
jgi:hypothetical protein